MLKKYFKKNNYALKLALQLGQDTSLVTHYLLRNQPGSPVGGPQQGLQGTGKVDKAVADQKKHCDDGSHIVQVGNQDAHLRNADGEGNGRNGLPFAGHVGKVLQDGEHIVLGNGLQKSWSS